MLLIYLVSTLQIIFSKFDIEVCEKRAHEVSFFLYKFYICLYLLLSIYSIKINYEKAT